MDAVVRVRDVETHLLHTHRHIFLCFPGDFNSYNLPPSCFGFFLLMMHDRVTVIYFDLAVVHIALC